MPGELQIESKPYTPVQVEETRKEGRELSARVPGIQAGMVSWALAMLVAALGATIVAFGSAVFFVVAGIVGVTTFIWYLWQANKWVSTDDQGNEISCLSGGVIARGVFLTLFWAFIAWCIWRVVAFVMVPIRLSAAFVERWATELKIIRALSAGLSFLALVFATAYWIHLELALGQELLYRSPFFEQFLHQGLWDWLFGWRLRKPRPKPEKVMVYGGKPDGDGRAVAEAVLGEVIEDASKQDAFDMMEFLIRGQRWRDADGQPFGYSRRKWDGVRLSSGTLVTEHLARRWAGLLKEAGLMIDIAGGVALLPGLSLGDALDHISLALDVDLPHPTTLRKWAGEGGAPIPSHPIPPTQEERDESFQ